ncbi:hypothetical protein Sulac_0329 [Sulfobacillus acidophilus DSM 10332]|uniref:Uncharacterized protein n=1 Tax=Sulfobacillus acidophilus (strain ATCC 700253 / DSM 10332 / NAL) TaxID=679936 RepID=G8TXJ9_SULAD|nr:hypothetical protein Sulac_0329 [Sulfobacillus acidophilus DSM 10332]
MSIMIDRQAEGNRAKELDADYTGQAQNSPWFKLGKIELKNSNPELLLANQDLTTSQILISVANPCCLVMIGLVGRGYKIARRGWSDFAIT